MPRLSKEKRLQILELEKEGLNASEIGRQLGCTSKVKKDEPKAK
jgi:IS30 family transposase